ncbi:MAG: hypothetical protein JSV33_11530 [bacterium]|nr:MAG: hypothetical protein JSV33_11530 [bacterium]
MRTGWIVLTLVLSAVVINVSPAFAKREAPKEVTPVEKDEIVFTAPHVFMGSVEARFKKTKELYWRKQVYVVKYKMGLEKDVQDCFITKLQFEKEKIVVSNEAGYRYQLDRNTLEVKPLEGFVVIDRNKKK